MKIDAALESRAGLAPAAASAAAAALDGRTAVESAWREALLRLPDTSVREVWLLDADFADWPLDDAAVLQALTRWAGPVGRCLRMVATRFDAVELRCPRFTAWRRDWAHRFEAWQPAADEVIELPGLLVAGNVGVEVLDRDHWHARRSDEAGALRGMIERAEAFLQRCERAWPATTLGL